MGEPQFRGFTARGFTILKEITIKSSVEPIKRGGGRENKKAHLLGPPLK